MTGDPPLGRVGRYELLRRIGVGGMGEVYEAVLHGPSGFRKRVAVKRLRSRADDRALAREARLGALLSHPNVVATWELSEAEGVWIVAMELVDGPSLSELRRAGPLPPGAIVDVGVQVAAALAHVHELTVEGRPMRVVHRDVKPSNLLVDPTGLVKLADLGIASLEAGAGSASGAGTPGYVAPEQIDGRAEPRSDLFSLGVVLAWLCTGVRPFGAGAEALVAVRRAEQHLRRGRALEDVDGVVPGLGPVVARCLRTDPEERWASARALGDALRALHRRAPSGPSLADLVAERHPRAPPEVGLPTSPTGTETWRTAVTGVPLTVGTSSGPEGPAPGPLIGRTAELEALRRALRPEADGPRLIGVRGPAGVGKTRLLAEVARAPRHQAEGGATAGGGPRTGAIHVDLEEARSLAGACTAIGAALGVPLTRGDPVDHLGAVLGGHGVAVLILDAADRVLDELGPVVRQWTVQAPDLRVILGSRRRFEGADLDLALGPLSDADAEEMLRARAGDAVREARPAEVRALIEALDGLPLAIELAASRAAFVPVAQLVDGFRGAERNPLRAAFATSWEGLSAPSRAVLAQLTVFAGGWELPAAEAVLDPGAGDGAMDALQDLVDRSLVQATPPARPGAAARFRLLASVRAFATEHLGAEAGGRAEQRHSEWYARLAVLADPQRAGPDRGDELQILSAERDNLLVALRRSVRRGDRELAGACALAILATLLRSGPLEPGLALIEEVLGGWTPRDPPAPREAELRIVAGVIAGTRGEREAAADHFARALDVARRTGDRAAEVASDLQLGNLLREMGDPAGAEVCLQRALAGAEALGHRRLLGRVIADLAPVFRVRGDLDSAERTLLRAIAVHREVRNHRAEATALNNLANLRSQRGRYDESRALYLEALRMATATADAALEATVYMNLALDEGREGRRGATISYLQRALRLQRRLGAVPMQIVSLGNLGWALLEQGDLDTARGVLEESLAMADRHGLGWLATTALGNLGQLELLLGRADLAEATVQRALQAELDAGDERSAMVLRLVLSSILRAGDADLVQAFEQVALAEAWARARDDGGLLAEARLERGILHLRCGDAERAEADLVAAEPGLGASDRLRARAALVWARALRGADPAEVRLAMDPIDAEAAALGMRPGAPLLRWLAEVRARIEAPQ